jgi:allophanate hydrolase subunit 2
VAKIMIVVIKSGLENSFQDYPGRIGYWNQGFPPSGPMDSWSFRLANLLVGNPVGAAGLECQYVGPTLKFQRDALIAVCGANLQPKLDGEPLRMWESVAVKAGQVLQLAFGLLGVRSYIAVAGGIDTSPWLGSRSTFHKAGVGGMEGHALKPGQVLPVGTGPQWTFSEKATNKGPEHGSEPSNIIDQGYPGGGINLAGQTPIILVNDGPSMGGFINPYTVPSSVFWKLGQSKPGDIYRFKAISVDESQEMSRHLNQLCSEASIC